MEPTKLNARNFPKAPKELLEAKIVEVAVGRHHTILITKEGEAYSAGWNSMGQVRVFGSLFFLFPFLFAWHSCTNDSPMNCGGFQCGQTRLEDQLDFKRIEGALAKKNERVVQGSAGINFTMLVTESGRGVFRPCRVSSLCFWADGHSSPKVYGMGSPEKGQLGNGRASRHADGRSSPFDRSLRLV
jgi:hypothetical protein